MLNELIDVFVKFLSNEENAKYVDSTSSPATRTSPVPPRLNRQLSTRQGKPVRNTLLTGKGAKLDGYAEYFCAAGYGATRPVASNDTAEGQAANRRIEISMILKDESVLEIVEQYLEWKSPARMQMPPRRHLRPRRPRRDRVIGASELMSARFKLHRSSVPKWGAACFGREDGENRSPTKGSIWKGRSSGVRARWLLMRRKSRRKRYEACDDAGLDLPCAAGHLGLQSAPSAFAKSPRVRAPKAEISNTPGGGRCLFGRVSQF